MDKDMLRQKALEKMYAGSASGVVDRLGEVPEDPYLIPGWQLGRVYGSMLREAIKTVTDAYCASSAAALEDWENCKRNFIFMPAAMEHYRVEIHNKLTKVLEEGFREVSREAVLWIGSCLADVDPEVALPEEPMVDLAAFEQDWTREFSRQAALEVYEAMEGLDPSDKLRPWPLPKFLEKPRRRRLVGSMAAVLAFWAYADCESIQGSLFWQMAEDTWTHRYIETVLDSLLSAAA